MSIEMTRGLYDYHRWANGRLIEVATALGEDLASRDVGQQFSDPTVRRMFGHHRSEIATMMTMISGSPPDTGINSYLLEKTSQP